MKRLLLNGLLISRTCKSSKFTVGPDPTNQRPNRNIYIYILFTKTYFYIYIAGNSTYKK